MSEIKPVPRQEKGRHYFWQSKVQVAPGLPECELFAFEGRVFAQRYHASEMLPGSAPMSRLMEVYLRPAKGAAPESLFEFPSNNRKLGAGPQNVSRSANDPQGGGVADFYLDQKGYRYATPEDCMRVMAACDLAAASAVERKAARDPVNAEKLKGQAMASAMAAALAEAFKEQSRQLAGVVAGAIKDALKGGGRG